MFIALSSLRRAATAVAVLALLVAAPASAEDAGTALDATDGSLRRNSVGHLSATLTNGSGAVAAQQVTFAFDANGDGTTEAYTGTTDGAGVAYAEVLPTRPTGPAQFTVSWTDGTASASDTGVLTITDSTTVTLASSNPVAGQVTDRVTVSGTLTDSDGAPVAGTAVHFSVGSATASGTTDADGVATASLRLLAPAGSATLSATFFGTALYEFASDAEAFAVLKEDTSLSLITSGGGREPLTLQATLTEDGGGLPGATVVFESPSPSTGVPETLGTATTDSQGVARLTVAPRHFWLLRPDWPVTAMFAATDAFNGSTASATAGR